MPSDGRTELRDGWRERPTAQGAADQGKVMK
jgi:hypothetical protein